MIRIRFALLASLLFGLLFNAATPALAQSGSGGVTISIAYPSMVVGMGETVTLSISLKSSASEIVNLDVTDLPKDWVTEYRGAGRLVHSAYLEAELPSTVELRVTTPTTVKAGTYDFNVTAKGSDGMATFPVEFIVKDKAPASLAFSTDYPTLRGGPDSPFAFSLNLKNDGDDDITVNLAAEAPKDLAVTFKAGGKDITNLPTDIKANSTQRIDVSATPLTSLAVGKYPIKVTAQSDTVSAEVGLTAEVVGQPQLTLTTADGALSGKAYINKTNPIKLVLRNAGNSPAEGVKLLASAPTGWTVTLNPSTVVEVPANDQVEVEADVKPADNAISGDYVVTFDAQPNGSPSKTADFRITVETSTVWGLVGILLIAAAVTIVGMAVTRFGRR